MAIVTWLKTQIPILKIEKGMEINKFDCSSVNKYP